MHLKECREFIKSDFARLSKRKFKFLSFFKMFLFQPTFRYLFFFRINNCYDKLHPFGLLGRMWYYRMKGKFGLQIFLKAKIGMGFCLNHYGNIIINQGAIFGDNCNISHGVTIGSISRGKLKGCPRIGNRVWIGPNAVVVGDIEIGNDVLIAPLTFVNKDIPDNAVVSGNPCKINNYNSSHNYIKNLYTNKLHKEIN